MIHCRKERTKPSFHSVPYIGKGILAGITRMGKPNSHLA